MMTPQPGALIYPWVAQQGAADCGPASLAMVVRFHGVDASLAGLRQQVRTGARGATLLQLVQAASALGFRCLAVRLGLEHLSRARLPAIAHLAQGHFVVLYSWASEGAVVGDPAVGVRGMSRLAFQNAWTGVLLLLAPPGATSFWHGSGEVWD